MDNGLLTGIGAGLTGGLDSYRNERDYAEKKRKDLLDEALKKKSQQIAEKEKGFVDDGSGNLDWNDQKKREMDYSAQEYDPNSDVSKRQNTMAKGLLDSAEPGLGDSFPQGMSAHEVGQTTKEGLLGKTLTGIYGKQGREIVAARTDARNQILREGLGIRKDAQSSHAVDTVTKDPQIEQMNNQVNLVDRGRQILNKPGLTNQEFNDTQIELSNAISGARSAAMGKLERTEYDSAQQRWAELMQKITGKPQDAIPPEILARAKSLTDETIAMLKKHRSGRAQSLGRHFQHNPDAEDQMNKAIQGYAVDPEEPTPAKGMIPTQPQGLIKPTAGKVKVSNGKETLMIDPADVQHAAADGYKVIQ